jgi:cytochrome P450
MDNGADLECFAARLSEGIGKLGFDEISMTFGKSSQLCCLAFYGVSQLSLHSCWFHFEAGTDNTTDSILWFIEVIMLHPDVLKKAQAEIDSVLGAQADTAPGFRHLKQLPYCVSLTKEVFRWMPIAPNGGPRQTMEDDEYKGYHIPAGTTVFANVWSIHHNESIYPEPFAFKPERFLPKDGSVLGPESLNEGHYGIGFGRW